MPRLLPWRSASSGIDRPLLIFAGGPVLSRFANASVLPLASERLDGTFESESALVTSVLIIVPQLVTALVEGWMARKADERGRRTMLLIAFRPPGAHRAVRRRARAVVPCGVQCPGGLDAAVIGILTPLVVADCAKGTRRCNVALGADGMVRGIGATISTTATGYVAQN